MRKPPARTSMPAATSIRRAHPRRRGEQSTAIAKSRPTVGLLPRGRGQQSVPASTARFVQGSSLRAPGAVLVTCRFPGKRSCLEPIAKRKRKWGKAYERRWKEPSSEPSTAAIKDQSPAPKSKDRGARKVCYRPECHTHPDSQQLLHHIRTIHSGLLRSMTVTADAGPVGTSGPHTPLNSTDAEKGPR
jgi:hypothetical protein